MNPRYPLTILLIMFLFLSGRGQYSSACFMGAPNPEVDLNQPWPYASLTYAVSHDRDDERHYIATKYLYEVDEYGYLKRTSIKDLDERDLSQGITEPEVEVIYTRNEHHQIVSSTYPQSEWTERLIQRLYHPNGQVAYERQIQLPPIGSTSIPKIKSSRYRSDGLILADTSWSYHQASGLEELSELTTYQYEGENLTEEIQYIPTGSQESNQVREHKKWVYTYQNDSLLKESYFEWDTLGQALQLQEFQEYSSPPGQEFVFIRSYKLDSTGFGLRNLYREYDHKTDFVHIYRKERWEEPQQRWYLTHNDTTIFDEFGRETLMIRNIKHTLYDNWTSPDTMETTYLADSDVVLLFEYFLNGGPWCQAFFQFEYQLRDDFSLNRDPPVFQIQAFPNPTSGTIQVLFPENTLNRIEVYGPTGQPLYQHEANAKVFEVDMRAYRSGMYFLRGISGDQMAVEKVVRE